MALLSASTLVFGGLSFVIYSIVIHFVRWQHLCHIPGPPLAGWSGLWLLRHAVSGRLCTKLEDLCKQYGSLVRIAPDWVVCSDPTEIRRIWSVHSGYYRAQWYKASRLNPDEDNVLTVTENKTHHRLRAHLLPGYGAMSNNEQIVDEQISKLIALLESKYISTRKELRPCDLARTMQYLTQDAITSVGFGKTAGYLDVDRDMYGVLKTCEDVLLPAHVLSLLPVLRWIVATPIIKPLLPKPTDKHGIGAFLGHIKGHVDERYDGEKIRRNDVLQSLVDSDLSRKQVESEALVTLFGGTDTTATGLRNTIFFLSTNPGACRVLQAEIDEAANTATRPVIADDHAKKLPYLQACIREGLRLWPPSMGLMGKLSDTDDVLCGYKVPAKTQVGWAAIAVMKDRRVFGENADVFEPRRWLDAEPAQLKEMEAVYGLVFATGTRWECLGKKLAYVELGKVIFELFFRYDFAMVTPMQPFKWLNHGLTAQHGMNAKITRRESADSVLDE